MNEVTAKILTVLENQGSFAAKDGSGNWYKHGIIYEGSSQMWELLNRTPTCTEFKVGEEASFTTETKVNGNFTNYKIRPVKTAAPSGGFKPGFKSGGGGFKPKEPKTERLIVIQSVFAALCNKTQGSTITTDQVWAATKKIYDEMMSLAAIPHKSEAIVPAPVAPVVEVAPAPVPAPVVPKPVVKKAAPVVQPNPLEQFNNEEPDDLPF
jgi:hypothetical protein